MKMLLVICAAALGEDVLEAIKAHGVTGYTRWDDVCGDGRSGGPHLGIHVWPVTNQAYAFAVEEEKIPELLETVRELRSRFPDQGVKAFVWSLEEVT